MFDSKFIGLQYSFCDKIIEFYLHVYTGKDILPSQVPTLGLGSKIMQWLVLIIYGCENSFYFYDLV
jgi:hypothetical protein